MSRLCERPGCSEPGTVAYGMVPEDLLFWMSVIDEAPVPDPNVLCRRHADAMVVPRGWTLDDLRDDMPRLFRPKDAAPVAPAPRPAPRRSSGERDVPEQLQIDGTGEIARPTDLAAADDSEDTEDTGETDVCEPWQPDFDAADDLDGLLEVSSPLLARAFRGTDRPKR